MSSIPTYDDVKFDYVLSVDQSIDEMRDREQAFDLWFESVVEEARVAERNRITDLSEEIMNTVIKVNLLPEAKQRIVSQITNIINGEKK